MNVLHFWSIGNHAGDFIAAWAQRELLQKALGPCTFWNVSLMPHRGCVAPVGLTSQNLSMLDSIGGPDLIIIGPCPLYGNSFQALPGDLAAIENIRAPVLVWGTGVDDGEVNEASMEMILALHRKSKKPAAVRDNGTVEWLAEHGVAAVVTGDPSLFAQRYFGVADSRRSIIYAHREGESEHLHSALQSLSELPMTDDVVFLAMSEGDYEDLLLCMGKPSFGRIVYTLKLPRLLELLGGALYVFGDRLHAVMTACSYGVPCALSRQDLRCDNWRKEFPEVLEAFTQPLTQLTVPATMQQRLDDWHERTLAWLMN